MKMQELHKQIVRALPKCRLWFYEGKDNENKTLAYQGFFSNGDGADTTGIFVHILGIKAKNKIILIVLPFKLK